MTSRPGRPRGTSRYRWTPRSSPRPTGSKQAVAFLREVITGLRTAFGRRLPLEFRMDAAFCQRSGTGDPDLDVRLVPAVVVA